ncbi:MAG: 4-hydroxy-tetrahydrodipicolinate reductase [Muribaculaceae bacterium]|nr:4-hydroxy-tetrahydrodipicolinate reductase [Muribaculaceae bacterium]
MKIALIGYGKMGHAVERFAVERGHEIVCRIDETNADDFDSVAFARADVAIEFSVPGAAALNYERAFAKGVPVVSGTTGWMDQMPRVRHILAETGATLLWSSNFSIGVNLFMRVSEYLARLMEKFPQYAPAMKEIHHIHKLDHPSGTAITIAEGIIANNPRVEGWTEDETSDTPGRMVISHERVGEVPGTHIVSWTSPVDAITIEHRAFSRDGFALGAVMAAEWVVANPDRKGLLSVNDMLSDL